ncbi:hypothetical protein SAMN04488692_11569 [Halarsenatibacter silvermanii]|uniref:Uncharacterized protein n=1 Tax=Halarsenatibacter silvermanii TaxID=321763 RepID=A0A1G9Q6X6_9FIRM|nr:hypothetical protein SAMN04488692_11569 [Halarsenatibacter silvermanii]
MIKNYKNGSVKYIFCYAASIIFYAKLNLSRGKILCVFIVNVVNETLYLTS